MRENAAMLPDEERFRLLRGPYVAPKTKVGGSLVCRLRGRVKVSAMSTAPIPWPIVHRPGGKRGLALCGDLVKAIRVESSYAIERSFGVSPATVRSWRRALGIDGRNEGSRRLVARPRNEGGIAEATLPLREANYANLEGGEKIAAKKRGISRPPHVREATLLGKPFTLKEDILLGMMPDKEVAERTGRHQSEVAKRRERLGIAESTGK